MTEATSAYDNQPSPSFIARQDRMQSPTNMLFAFSDRYTVTWDRTDIARGSRTLLSSNWQDLLMTPIMVSQTPVGTAPSTHRDVSLHISSKYTKTAKEEQFMHRIFHSMACSMRYYLLTVPVASLLPRT